MKAAEIKKWFKTNFNIPVRVNTVAVKNPFVQVWISPEKTPRHTDPLVYKHEFSAELGKLLLAIIYGERHDIMFPAGNVQKHRMSFDQREWELLKAEWEVFKASQVVQGKS